MRINRAIGLIIFLLIAKVLLADVFVAFSRSIVATMGTVETASQTATATMLEHR